MRKLVSLFLAATLVLALSACASVGKKGVTRVKCPACGYEFEVPANQ